MLGGILFNLLQKNHQIDHDLYSLYIISNFHIDSNAIKAESIAKLCIRDSIGVTELTDQQYMLLNAQY